MKTSKTPLHLKLTLKYAKPPVWRDIAVPGDATMEDLHHYIQFAFGWDDYHLHNFMVGRFVEFCPKEAMEDSFNDCFDEAKASVYEVFQGTNKVLYTYDFGDNWEVEITCKGYYEKEPVTHDCLLLKMKGNNPPEDCGGIYGFMELEYYREHPKECDEEMLDRLAYYYPDEFDEPDEDKDKDEEDGKIVDAEFKDAEPQETAPKAKTTKTSAKKKTAPKKKASTSKKVWMKTDSNKP